MASVCGRSSLPIGPPVRSCFFGDGCLRDLQRAGALTGARVIWSQWDGYLKEGSGAQLKADCKARGIPFELIHTSGHASIADLKRLAAAVRPNALVPIHTFEAERFPDLFENVVLRQDGEWWEV